MGMMLQVEDSLPYIRFLRVGSSTAPAWHDYNGSASAAFCANHSPRNAYVQTTSYSVLCTGMKPHRGLFCARGSNLKNYEFGAVESADERGVGILRKELCQQSASELTPFHRMDRRTQEWDVFHHRRTESKTENGLDAPGRSLDAPNF